MPVLFFCDQNKRPFAAGRTLGGGLCFDTFPTLVATICGGIYGRGP